MAAGGWARLDPVEAFRRALCRYLHDRGATLFSMASVTGQERARVALLALYRRHEPEETGYPRFEHVLAAIEECGDRCRGELEELGVEGFETLDGEPYIVFSLDKLRGLLEGGGCG